MAARLRAADVDAPTCLRSCTSKMATIRLGRSCASLVNFGFGIIEKIACHKSPGQPRNVSQTLHQLTECV